MLTKIKMASFADITIAQQRTRGIKHFTGHASSKQFNEVPDDINVRSAMKKRGDVHKAIAATILENPEEFTELSSGLTFIATSAKVDKDNKEILFDNLGLINGSQTRRELATLSDERGEPIDIMVKVEFIVLDDADYASEISVARNTQNRVKDISTFGSAHVFDALNELFLKAFSLPVKQSETDDSQEVIDTYRVIQVAFVLMPAEVASKYIGEDKASATFEQPQKVYGQKAWCLKEYKKFYDLATADPDKNFTPKSKDVLFFNILNAFAVEAWKVYQKVVGHTPRRQRNLSIFDYVRDYQDRNFINAKTGLPANKELISGIAFPILYSLQPFVTITVKKGEPSITIDTSKFEAPTTEAERVRTKQFNRFFAKTMESRADIADTVAKSRDIYMESIIKSEKLKSANVSVPDAEEAEDGEEGAA